jgi:hypothetical protein
MIVARKHLGFGKNLLFLDSGWFAIEYAIGTKMFLDFVKYGKNLDFLMSVGGMFPGFVKVESSLENQSTSRMSEDYWGGLDKLR